MKKVESKETKKITKPAKEAKEAANLSPLQRARKALKTVLKEDHVTPLSDKLLRQTMPHIPTGSLTIDYLIGGRPNQYGVAPCPGIPRAKIMNLYGTAGAGKTTLALTTAASVCNSGGTCVYIDWENEIEPRYASRIGVPVTDESKFLLMQPNTLEEGMKIMVQMAREGVDLIVIDSVGAATPEDLYNRDLDEEGQQTRIGLVAQKWSQFLPKYKSLISKSNSAVLGISQLRKKIDKMGHGPDAEPQGGEAWKFYSAVRMMLRVFQKEKGKQFNAVTGKVEDFIVGTQVIAKLDKCKVSDSVHHEQKFYLRSGLGIDNTRSVVDLALAYKVIDKEGSYYGWTHPKSGELIRVQGLDAFIKSISSDNDTLRTLFAQVVPKLSAAPPGGETDIDSNGSDDEEVIEELFNDIVPTGRKKPEAAEPLPSFLSDLDDEDEADPE